MTDLGLGQCGHGLLALHSAEQVLEGGRRLRPTAVLQLTRLHPAVGGQERERQRETERETERERERERETEGERQRERYIICL